MEITIKDKVYKIKYTLRALFIFEQVTGKPFAIETLTDEYVFFYSLIMANNKDCELTFDGLIDELDEKPEIMKQYNDFMLKEYNKQKQFKSEEVTSDDKKKR